ncbi:MAG: XamI family restriction endonuclease [Gaiellaceae bacterium]
MTVDPLRWTEAQLDADRRTAIEAFRAERMQEPLEQYLEAFDDYRGAVEDLLEATVDLTQLGQVAVQVLTDPALLEAVRYLAGPPISADDLKTLADVRSLAAGRLRSDPEMARRVIDTVLLGLDRRRFPWVAENREPDEAERNAAALGSAALMASRRVMTYRANEAKTAQEQAVEDRLLAAKFEKIPTPRQVPSLAQAPDRGQFCRETTFGTRKADLLVGLWDDRKMPLECKVSNSSVNSIKRLNNDAAVKAVRWLEEFGTRSVVPAAVLSGVYHLPHLVGAQAASLTIIWSHNLDALADWIESTRTNA